VEKLDRQVEGNFLDILSCLYFTLMPVFAYVGPVVDFSGFSALSRPGYRSHY
jgi:hypothetical protein